VSTLTSSELRRAVVLLEAGDWQAAHQIVQQDEDSPLPCWAHGIVHIMEGDLPNARYWYRQAKRSFPAAPSVPAEIAALKSALRSPTTESTGEGLR
jgi:hypothetical protein